MKDIKYIIKRVIIGVLIAIILMAIKNVNAEEIGSISNVNIHSNWNATQVFTVSSAQTNASFYETELAKNPPLKNYGKGFVIFSLDYYANGTYQPSINGVSIKSGSDLFACEIGNTSSYSDNNVMHNVMSIKCYVNLGSSGVERIRFQSPYRPTNMGTLAIYLSRYMTFVGSPSPTSNQDIINTITNNSQQQIALEREQITNQQTIIQQQTQTNQKLSDINDNLTNDTPADSNEISIALDPGNLPGGGAISNLLSLPLILLNQLLSVLGFSCTDAIIPLPFVNQSFKYECVDNIFNKLGWSTQWEITGTIAGAIVLYYYLLYLYDRVNHILFLEDKGDLRKYY